MGFVPFPAPSIDVNALSYQPASSSREEVDCGVVATYLHTQWVWFEDGGRAGGELEYWALGGVLREALGEVRREVEEEFFAAVRDCAGTREKLERPLCCALLSSSDLVLFLISVTLQSISTELLAFMVENDAT
jgi:hypothetical protein